MKIKVLYLLTTHYHFSITFDAIYHLQLTHAK